ncbi:hypothetical protein IHE45_10G043500 [Dioscorea alata]|uniref:Uncharacterized protein n=1 Tax=Dioscorea alata TaxID=55571 RepID=A0ACB7VAP4_DIOAL|nr:hypothetical protein IHE45_10G043500 [Dioscorea alata]
MVSGDLFFGHKLGMRVFRWLVNFMSILAKLGVVWDIHKLSIRTRSLRSRCNLSGARKDKFVPWGIIGKSNSLSNLKKREIHISAINGYFYKKFYKKLYLNSKGQCTEFPP